MVCMPGCMSSVCQTVKNLGQCQFRSQPNKQNKCYRKVNLITLADSPPLAFSCAGLLPRVTLGSCNYTICLPLPFTGLQWGPHITITVQSKDRWSEGEGVLFSVFACLYLYHTFSWDVCFSIHLQMHLSFCCLPANFWPTAISEEIFNTCDSLS